MHPLRLKDFFVVDIIKIPENSISGHGSNTIKKSRYPSQSDSYPNKDNIYYRSENDFYEKLSE